MFPENDTEILESAVESNQYIKNLLSGISELPEDSRIFYDNENINLFLEKFKELDDKYIHKLEYHLKERISKKSTNIATISKRDYEASYIQYTQIPFCVIPAHPMISEIAERYILYSDQEQIFVNLGKEIQADRDVFLVLKEIHSSHSLFDKIISIYTVNSFEEFVLWLKTKNNGFTLLNKKRFKRTKYHAKNDIIFQEIDTDYYWYWDSFHDSHYEVFAAWDKYLGEASRDGIIDYSKADDKKDRSLDQVK